MPIKTISTVNINSSAHSRVLTIPRCFAQHIKISSWDILGTAQARISDRIQCLLAHDVSQLNITIETLNDQLATFGCNTSESDINTNSSASVICQQSLKQLNQIKQQWGNIIDSYQIIAKAKGYWANDDSAFIQTLNDYYYTLQTLTIEAHIDYSLLYVQQSETGSIDNADLSCIQTLINHLPRERDHAVIHMRFASLLLFMHTRQQAHIQTLNTQIIKLKTDVVEAPRQQERHAQHRFEQYRDNINQLKRENAWLKGRHTQIKRRFEDFVNGEQRDDNQPAFSYISGQMLWPHRARPLTLDWFHPFKPEEYQARGLQTELPADIKADKPITHKLQAFK